MLPVISHDDEDVRRGRVMVEVWTTLAVGEGVAFPWWVPPCSAVLAAEG